MLATATVWLAVAAVGYPGQRGRPPATARIRISTPALPSTTVKPVPTLPPKDVFSPSRATGGLRFEPLPLPAPRDYLQRIVTELM